MGEWSNVVPEAAGKLAELADWDRMTEKQRRKNLMLVAKGVGYTYGIPLTGQMMKSINTAYNGGNPYEIIVGVYKEQKKRSKAIPTL